jgi:AbrB family looped-hinge helix DNA binding protein
MESRMTARGRTTVPKEIRDRLDLKPGDRISWHAEGNSAVLRPKKRSINELAGILHRPDQRPVSLEEIDEAIAEGAAESAFSGLNRSGQ